VPDQAEQLDRLKAALSDRYRLERQLGAGGMATVYLAHDLKHDRRVAIKVLRPKLAAERFVQEIKTAFDLQHPKLMVSPMRNRRWRAMSLPVICAVAILNLACGDQAGGPTAPAPPSTPEVAPEIVQWLTSNSVAFETVDVRGDRTDLETLDAIVGDARIVALGEATHGTREFFTMKHRVLDYLVKEKGFTLFAMEATWPEMNRLDDWVNGHRDRAEAEILLSGQYFWTWNTSSVLDLLFWARDYNEAVGAARPVSVLGFDMQFPGMAIHNVVTYLEAIDPAGATFAGASYDCMDANDSRGFFAARYGERDAAYQNACRGDIDAVFEYLSTNRGTLEAASSPEALARARQSARLVQQFEDMEAQRLSGARDRYMAENVDWLLEQAEPGTKAVLWAHNFHVSDTPGAMGTYLRTTHGSDMVVIGFDFDRGSFTAVTIAPDGSFTERRAHAVGSAPSGSYESFFRAAEEPRFILDMRGVNLGTPATSWLAGPRSFRSIGCCYAPSDPNRFFRTDRLPALFDVMIFIEQSTPTNVLPYTPPDQF
jgi:erythromycin esterase